MIQTLDIVIFTVSILVAMAVGLIASRKETSASDYFLAGHQIRWWGVAASIFGSNVSANHLVGMLGAGFSIGFAQSHFELGAIAGLMVLCFGFLPVYRKLKVYTLSEYLGRRYDDRSRVVYAIIMLLIMAIIQMAPALYIGSRSLCILLGGSALETAEGGTATNVNMTYYIGFVVAMAVISASYTIMGGLKAVVWTDVVQSVLLLLAGVLVAIFAFNRLGGWNVMMTLDGAATLPKMKLYLPMNHPQLPWTGMLTGLMAMHCFYWGTNQFIVQRALGARSDREARLGIISAGFLKLLIPFFSIATGTAAFYLFRRELGPDHGIAQDAVFSELIKRVLPVGYGIVGLVGAGVIGAILSSIDSMMNSAATIFSFDIYKRYIRPKATDAQMIFVARISILVFVTFATLVAIFVLDPNSKDNFFLKIADYSGYLTPGLLVTFFWGMFWRRGTATAAFFTLVAAAFVSFGVAFFYDSSIGMNEQVYQLASGKADYATVDQQKLPKSWHGLSTNEASEDIAKAKDQLEASLPIFGTRDRAIQLLGYQLNFFHRVVAVLILLTIAYVVVSLLTQPDPEKARLVWTDLGGHAKGTLKLIVVGLLVSIGFFVVLAVMMVQGWLPPVVAGFIGAAWTLAMFVTAAVRSRGEDAPPWIFDDRIWAGILSGAAVFLMYAYY